MDTNETTVTPDTAASAPRRRRDRRWVTPFAAFVAMVLLLVAAYNISLPYVALYPGSATPVEDLIAVPDDQDHPPSGDILFTTVGLSDTTVIDAVRAWFDPSVELVPRERFYPPNVSSGEYRQLNLEMMQASEQKAIVVALRRLGYEVTEQGTGALVVAVQPGTPAEGVLAPGDVITGVDGQPVQLSRELVAAVQAHAPGDAVTFEVRSAEGATRSVEVRLGELDGKAFLGVQLITKDQSFSTPFQVDIDTGRVGGPSAGLAFTLAVLDTLTPGELTGGRKVAVTGTIEEDGTVGVVGGVAQKAAAVRAAGADIFLVPEAEVETARARAGDDVEVVGVSTLDDALVALGELGGNVQALAPEGGGPAH